MNKSLNYNKNNQIEYEIEYENENNNLPNEIFHKQFNFILSNQTEIILLFHALEYSFPYTLTMLFISSSTYNKIDITKEDLAYELREWISGKIIQFPCKIVSKRINDTMMNFIKYGRPPSQTDIFMWMLSRTEIYPKKNKLLIYFGGKDNIVSQDNNNYSTEEIKQLISLNSPTLTPYFNINNTNSNINANINSNTNNHPNSTLERSKSAPTKRSIFNNDTTTYTNTNTNTTTKNTKINLTNISVEPPIEELIGKSQAISQLKTNEIKGRKDAKKAVVNLELTDDHYRLMNHISNRRKEIEKTLETRRRVIKTGVTRNDQTINKYRQIYENTTKSKGSNNWIRTANEEIMNLDRIQTLLEEDLKRQTIQNQRNAEHIRWTMAPNGYEIYRGKYQKGYVIGPGPLPPDATTSLRDSQITSTLKNYTWDEHGRRHRNNEFTNSNKESQSNMEEAMNLIRKASTNASLYKLNLKDIFDDMDVSGDGYINIQEMKVTFEKLGLSLNMESLNNLFNYFDRNHSGTVHYGEFIWAFFNRRSFLKQFKKNTKNLTKSQIVNKFYEYDNNGNGTLNQKEFKRLLKSLKIELNESDISILMNKFDFDGDGELDLDELYKYIQEELDNSKNQTINETINNSNTSNTSNVTKKSSKQSNTNSKQPNTNNINNKQPNRNISRNRNSNEMLSTNSSKSNSRKSYEFQENDERSLTPPPPYSAEPDEESLIVDIDNYLINQKKLSSNQLNENSQNINQRYMNGNNKLEDINENEIYDENMNLEDNDDEFYFEENNQKVKDPRRVVTVNNIQQLLQKQPTIESKLKKYYNRLNQTN